MWAFYPNLKKVTIKTHSVYIIQTLHKENIFIVQHKNEELVEEDNDLTKKLYNKNPGDLFNENGLTVL